MGSSMFLRFPETYSLKILTRINLAAGTIYGFPVAFSLNNLYKCLRSVFAAGIHIFVFLPNDHNLSLKALKHRNKRVADQQKSSEQKIALRFFSDFAECPQAPQPTRYENDRMELPLRPPGAPTWPHVAKHGRKVKRLEMIREREMRDLGPCGMVGEGLGRGLGEG